MCIRDRSKKEYVEALQKDLTKTCFRACFNIKVAVIDQQCFDNCYRSYLNTVRTVYRKFKDVAYANQSQYAYKCFPEEDEWFEVYYQKLFSVSQIKPPHGFIEEDYIQASRKR
eukprot:TRINITY_DN8494_c0_g1_i2.p2 TRINITY_DN8494_c0_g1~~TRINITY_DN8494_c0_g1_i2.p2  ORF type:complete len:132 (-),score=27.83 TRINITY_DN8494_c0_g1_i2:116-454(-)